MTTAPTNPEATGTAPTAPADAAPDIYNPDHIPATSDNHYIFPLPTRLSVPDYPGSKFFRLRRLIVLGGALALIPLTLFAVRPFAENLAVTRGLTIAGWTLIGLGLLFRFYALLHIAGVIGRKIVDTGPYAMVRHPLYFGSFLAGCGIVLLTGAPICWAAFLIVGAGTYLGTIVFEERRMTVDFPGAVQDYRAKVAMLIPTRIRLQKPEILPPGLPLLKESLTAAGFLAAAAAIQALVYLAEHYHLPAVLRFW